ncbi:MAG: M28 family peptidase [Chloroflexi bacterium]|nr:M28 family peptidase [Chloroflexota bacterium]
MMSPLMDTIRYLAKEIGPRGSATPQEKQAAEYIAKRLSEAGMDTDIQPFQAPGTFSLTFSLIYLGFIVAVALYHISPLASCILAMLSLLLFVAEQDGVETLSRVMPKGPSQNVRGIRSPSSKPKQRLIITAHMDSSRAALLWHPSMVAGFRRSLILMTAAMFVIVALSLVGLMVPLRSLWLVQVACALYLTVSVLIMVHRELFMKHTPGANDNASGVAVLLAAAETLTDLQQTELWAVATGCEEAGLFGMQRFMEAHHFDREHTYFINLDNLGAGKTAYITGEGILRFYPSDPTLLKIAGEVVAEQGLDAESRPYRALTTDSQIPLRRGYKAMSIMAFDQRGVLPNWHWETDTPDNIDPTTVETAYRLLIGIAHKLDAR